MARVDQWPPPGHEWYAWLLLGGRGGGKTRSGSEAVKLAEESGYRTIALVGRTPADIRDVMVGGMSGLLSCYPDRADGTPDPNRPVYEPSNRLLTWPSGAVAHTYSAQEGKQLRGPQHDFAWADETCAWPIKPRGADDNAWDQMIFGLRIDHRKRAPHLIVTTTPRPVDILIELIEKKSTRTSLCTTFDNRANLASSFFDEIVERYKGTRLYDQEVLAMILKDIEGALWTRDTINKYRIERMPQFGRKYIGIDPAGTAAETSDETGIVAVAKGVDEYADHGFTIADKSLRETPKGWATAALKLYGSLDADAIVAEKNYGGDMDEHTIRTTPGGPNYPSGDRVRIIIVHASKSKALRAEPIAGMAEQGRWHHVGTFHELEDEQTTFVQGITTKSPNRLDAMVHAAVKLFPSKRLRQGIISSSRRGRPGA